ncbi:MAG: hypothetical protein NTX57_22845, partial [Armatimonadetes bacterium]|nr:hypothetical protein [Armatimonadota bacterium]
GMKVTISYTLTSLATSEIVLSYRSIEGERSETPQIALQTAITKSSKRFVAEHLVITFMDSASILAVDAKEGFLIDKGTSDGFTMALDFEIYEESAGAFGDLFKTKKVICLARAKQCESNKSLLITGEYKSDFRIRNEWKEKQELLKIINKGYKIRTIARREFTRII